MNILDYGNQLKGIDFMTKYNKDEEVWKGVAGFEEFYQVSTHGRVRSKDRITVRRGDGAKMFYKGQIMKTPLNGEGYPSLNLNVRGKKHSKKVHRLVAETFIENPNNYIEVNHIDEVKNNNHVSNLEWCTREHNMNHGTLWERVWAHPNQIKAFEDSKKAVIGIHIETEKKVRFESLSEADRQGFPRRNVQAVLNGYDKSCRGYVWFHEEEYTSELKDEKMKSFRIRVKQLDDDGDVLNEFMDTIEAGEFVGVHPSNISRAITQGRKSKGFNWIRD